MGYSLWFICHCLCFCQFLFMFCFGVCGLGFRVCGSCYLGCGLHLYAGFSRDAQAAAAGDYTRRNMCIVCMYLRVCMCAFKLIQTDRQTDTHRHTNTHTLLPCISPTSRGLPQMSDPAAKLLHFVYMLENDTLLPSVMCE